MKYFVFAILVLAGCSNDPTPPVVINPALVYSAKSEHVLVEGQAKKDPAIAKAAGAFNQMVLDSMDK